MAAALGRTPGRGHGRRWGELTVYAALWRILPGPWWVRLVILIVLLAAVLFALVEWVFPAVNEMLPTPDVTVENP
ncbi:hypothetical protein ASF17_10010 [Frigoribacterium sp. Leaf263]|nr:hypothetical protein ASF17_10010 [Frigoribacterium sp. Leaf263]KQR65818.1 hypothetical protein ASF89_01110 [Frigoribacterium sp. Leaf172]